MKRFSVFGLIVFLAIVFCFSFSGCDEDDGKGMINEYKFSARGVELSVGEDADEVISMLPEANYFSCAHSCTGEGDDEIYIYNGFRITVYREGDSSEICSIELTNDSISTEEGIFIGDSEARLLEIYGEGRPFSGGVEYFADNCILRFFVRGGKVTAIKYLKIDD